MFEQLLNLPLLLFVTHRPRMGVVDECWQMSVVCDDQFHAAESVHARMDFLYLDLGLTV